MRYEMVALDWDLLGRRPVLATFTMPAKWRALCPDARSLDRMRKALHGAWTYRHGAPVAFWVVEFQPRAQRALEEQHAPHLHVYIGVPESVSEEEFEGWVRRTRRRHELDAQYGKYEGRRRLPALEGEFADWLLAKWSGIVGSADRWGMVDRHHRKRGVDITPAFWSALAESTANRTRIADYFWRESGKMGQKTPPEDFGGLAFYGRWGSRQGFVPQEAVTTLSEGDGYILRRQYVRLVEERMRADAAKAGRPYRPYKRPRGRDGLTVFGVDGEVLGPRAEEWAQGADAREGAREVKAAARRRALERWRAAE